MTETDAAYQQVSEDIQALKDAEARWREEDREKNKEARSFPVHRIEMRMADLFSDETDADNTYFGKSARLEQAILSQFPDSPVTQALKEQTGDKENAQYAYRCWAQAPGDSTAFSDEQMLQNIRETGLEKRHHGVPWMEKGKPHYYFFFQNMSMQGAHSYLLVYRNEHFQYPAEEWLREEKGHLKYETPPWDSEDKNLPTLSDLVVGMVVVDWQT